MTTLMLNRSRALPVAMAAALTGCLLLAVPGCGNRPRPETAADIPGYRDMLEDVGQVDTAPLRGRLILLDPGHGGFFRGARGPNGLEEADVNLGVSLYLRGLLDLDTIIAERITLDQVNEGFDAMRAGRSARSVIVFDT